MTPNLLAKLNPERFPNISLHMAAVMGYLLDQTYTEPAIVELQMTSDDAVIGRTSDQIKSFISGRRGGFTRQSAAFGHGGRPR